MNLLPAPSYSPFNANLPIRLERIKVVCTLKKTYIIPGEWVTKLLRAKVALPVHNFLRNEDIPCFKNEATEICQKYLRITDKNWWPALLGKSEIMDQVLDEEFKK